MSSTRIFDERFKKDAEKLAHESRLLPIGLDCVKCWDAGFLWIDVEGTSAWAYCRCEKGLRSSEGYQFALPIYTHEMQSMFKEKPFPAASFIPSSFKSFKAGQNEKMNAFKKSLRESEKFWKG